MRICYIGTEVSNLAHLINLQGQSHSRREHTTDVPLHLPYPAIHPTTPWKPEVDQGPFASKNRDYLRDLSSFPAKDVRDSLVDAYFEKINPFFPIVDECKFRRQYSDPADPPPLLQLQSVLLAGAHASTHPKVEQWRPMVCNALFRRAKGLFDMRHENDRMHLVQAALLFTWYLENADTGSANSYYWAGVACRIAFGLGMHRDLSGRIAAVVRMPLYDRRIYRRIWWTLFQVEIFTALEHGRPSMIHLDEIDQAPLDVDDFIEENGTRNPSLRLDYCQRNIELCYISLEVLRLNSPGIRRKQENVNSAVASLDSSLAAWMLKTPAVDNFGSLQLHLHYHAILIHLHRNFGLKSSNPKQQLTSPSNEVCSRSAGTIITILETTLAKDFLRQCSFTCVVSLTATAIHISQEIGHALDYGHTLLAVSGQSQLERLFTVAKELGVYWPNAEAVLKLFQNLSQRFKLRIIELLDDENTGMVSSSTLSAGIGTHANDQANDTELGSTEVQDPYWNADVEDRTAATYALEWQDLFIYPVMQQQLLSGDEEWMSMPQDLGMGT